MVSVEPPQVQQKQMKTGTSGKKGIIPWHREGRRMTGEMCASGVPLLQGSPKAHWAALASAQAAGGKEQCFPSPWHF